MEESILPWIEASPEHSVIWMVCTSDQLRTKQTMLAYGNALAQLQVNTNVLDVTECSRTQILDLLTHDHACDVVLSPLHIKQFGMQGRWYEDRAGIQPTAYARALMQKHQRDFVAAGVDWLTSGGVGEHGLHGQTPKHVAEQYLAGVLRAHRFAKSHTQRPVQILGVGHQMDLDAVLTYLANGGTCTHEGFYRVAPDGQTIGEVEHMEVDIDDSGKTQTIYRGQTFTSEIDLGHLFKQAGCK